MRIEIFQSYQGSILSEDKITNGIGKIPLSILSRFYFIWMSMMYWGVVVGLSILSRFYFINSKLTILGPYIDLSILSRFYFIYARRDNPASELFLSILSRFYFICGYLWKLNYLRLSFNPIKVLFYQVKQTVKVIEPKRLSILSRFYFINKRITEEEKNAKLSILSRFYFIPFLKSRNMLYIFSMGFEKKAHIGSSCYSIKRLDTFCFLNNVLNSSLILFNHRVISVIFLTCV